MRLAVIGAGIVGVTTALELANAGHDVSVFDRQAAVASESSFANAGIVGPGGLLPWAVPGVPRRLAAGRRSSRAIVRLGGGGWGHLPWLWRWWRSNSVDRTRPRWQAMQRLATLSRERLDSWAEQLRLEFEQSHGCLLLLRTEREVSAVRSLWNRLGDAAPGHVWLQAEEARRIEPALSADAPLAAALHWPDALVANCRQVAQMLRSEAQRRGAVFLLGHEVETVAPGMSPTLAWRSGQQRGEDRFDGIVVCTGVAAADLIHGCGLRLPLVPVMGCSITATLRHSDAAPLGPRSAVVDPRCGATIARLGQRVRVAGGTVIGAPSAALQARMQHTLHRAMDEWFSGAAQPQGMQVWHGARPTLPDCAPAVGASGLPGIWLNVGHGNAGWSLACGSARIVAELIGGQASPIDLGPLDPARLR